MHPKITVVIPSYNQAEFLEASIKSVIDQDYQPLEVFVLDGGSKDQSVEIIKKYDPYITYWRSERDNGQSNAIKEGFERSTGKLLTWINSDDLLLEGSLQTISKAFCKNQDGDVFYGDNVLLNRQGTIVEKFRHPRYYNKLAWLTMPYIAQPGTFFTKRIWQESGGVDTSLQYVFDYDLWYKFMLQDARFIHVGSYVSGFRVHTLSKGSSCHKEYALEHKILESRYQKKRKTKWHRFIGRKILTLIQIANGSYLSTFIYRILNQRRFSSFVLKD